jgi:hypothetical protein
MKKCTTILAIAAASLILFGLFGCSDDKGTSSKTKQMNNEQAAQLITANMGSIGMASISQAMNQTTDYWGGDWEEPYIGFKSAVPNDEWYEYENGWHIYHYDESVDSTVVNPEGPDTTISVSIELDDSLKFSSDGEPYEDWDEDIDRLEERAHMDLDGSIAETGGQSISFSLGGYWHSTLELDESDYLHLDMTEKYTLKMTISGAESGNGKFTYGYKFEAEDLVFSPDDDYSCPVSGTITVDVAISLTDNTGTSTANGTVTLTVDDGYVWGDVTVGNATEDIAQTALDCYDDGGGKKAQGGMGIYNAIIESVSR